ncbi:fahA [Bugula neritina]|uniref:oxaloacetate tautomerase n=1 Tax=Bugula neritina TaxID=10212 RepID=A0A7J7K0R9_BUGNE|nr:fahA [Bugula neritina]
MSTVCLDKVWERPKLCMCYSVYRLDYECELVVVISKEARNVKEADAMEHVFGYTVANDLTARDMVSATKMVVFTLSPGDIILTGTPGALEWVSIHQNI